MNFFNEEKIHIYLSYVIILLLILFSVLLFFLLQKVKRSADKVDVVTPVEVLKNDDLEVVSLEDEDVNTFKVDIKGAVKTPGVYEARKGMVVQDIITLAGGLKSGASTKYINLSYKVTDQMVIRILTSSEIKAIEKEIKEICVCPTVDTSSCDHAMIVIPEKENTKEEGNTSIIDKNTNTDAETKIDETNDSNHAIVSINSATLEELTSLSGIGESKAKAIIDYREKNGPFLQIEDLKNVSGIGDAVYQKIKNSIKL